MRTPVGFVAHRRNTGLPYRSGPETGEPGRTAAASAGADNGSSAGAVRDESGQRLIGRLRTFGIVGAGARPRAGSHEQHAHRLRRPEHTVAGLIAVLYQI
jgi:hypothetical protein